ncbi:AAA family ATPase [Pseudooceanicola sp. CBS1P-1]|nr:MULTISPECIES: AAA family ATPase [Pseudooceanicola]MBT9383169.1 AAA family ATPase [Pseudooceanicola endophyticus]
MSTQAATIAFLSTPAAFGAPADGPHPERIDTHGAVIFLLGDSVLKLKRAVCYDYMDLSTPELRHALLERELALNAPAAPMLYRDVVPVTEGPESDSPEIDGSGPVIDWVLRMHRFPAENELEAVAARGALDDDLAGAIGRMVQAYHAGAEIRPGPGAAPMQAILEELARVFGEFPGAPGTAQLPEALAQAGRALKAQGPLLEDRAAAGHRRRGHGDLHLRNLVLIDGAPVPFDALEFSEDLGTCDVLYDLAFLVMDLDHRGLARAATLVLSAYLAAAGGQEDAGLAAFPLFLSVRAMIRAMVLLQTDAATGQPGASAREIAAYLAQACAVLRPTPARLVAVGGVSGSGKSVLARALAPELGAVLLSTDEARKSAAHVGRERKMPGTAYGIAARGAVYEGLLARARLLLEAGQSVLLDGTFLDPARREAVTALGRDVGCPVTGLWLEAPEPVLDARVAARRNDWSDADTLVLAGQLAQGSGPLGEWQELDASGRPEATLRAAKAVLKIG